MKLFMIMIAALTGQIVTSTEVTLNARLITQSNSTPYCGYAIFYEDLLFSPIEDSYLSNIGDTISVRVFCPREVLSKYALRKDSIYSIKIKANESGSFTMIDLK